MADAISGFFDQLMNGETAGIKNIYIIIGIAFVVLIVYLVMTRKPKIKEFKPMDMKKETKRRLKRDYKYFGKAINKYIFDSSDSIKPIAYAIGYMKIVENKAMKKYEPIMPTFKKEDMDVRRLKYSVDYYGKPFDTLSPEEKRNIDDVVKEEMIEQKIQVTPSDEKIKFIRGRKETTFYDPIPMYAIKICQPNMMNKILARAFGYGIDWFIIEHSQIKEETNNKMILTADFQRRQPFDIFVFSQAGKNLIQDFTYGQERENIWQETANQIPRAVHFDTEASKMLLYRREDAKLEKEKRKSQTESHEMG